MMMMIILEYGLCGNLDTRNNPFHCGDCVSACLKPADVKDSDGQLCATLKRRLGFAKPMQYY